MSRYDSQKDTDSPLSQSEPAPWLSLSKDFLAPEALKSISQPAKGQELERFLPHLFISTTADEKDAKDKPTEVETEEAVVKRGIAITDYKQADAYLDSVRQFAKNAPDPDKLVTSIFQQAAKENPIIAVYLATNYDFDESVVTEKLLKAHAKSGKLVEAYAAGHIPASVIMRIPDDDKEIMQEITKGLKDGPAKSALAREILEIDRSNLSRSLGLNSHTSDGPEFKYFTPGAIKSWAIEHLVKTNDPATSKILKSLATAGLNAPENRVVFEHLAKFWGAGGAGNTSDSSTPVLLRGDGIIKDVASLESLRLKTPGTFEEFRTQFQKNNEKCKAAQDAIMYQVYEHDPEDLSGIGTKAMIAMEARDHDGVREILKGFSNNKKLLAEYDEVVRIMQQQEELLPAEPIEAALKAIAKDRGLPYKSLKLIIDELPRNVGEYEPGSGRIAMDAYRLAQNSSLGKESAGTLLHELTHFEQDVLTIKHMADRLGIKAGSTDQEDVEAVRKLYEKELGLKVAKDLVEEILEMRTGELTKPETERVGKLIESHRKMDDLKILIRKHENCDTQIQRFNDLVQFKVKEKFDAFMQETERNLKINGGPSKELRQALRQWHDLMNSPQSEENDKRTAAQKELTFKLFQKEFKAAQKAWTKQADELYRSLFHEVEAYDVSDRAEFFSRLAQSKGLIAAADALDKQPDNFRKNATPERVTALLRATHKEMDKNNHLTAEESASFLRLIEAYESGNRDSIAMVHKYLEMPLFKPSKPAKPTGSGDSPKDASAESFRAGATKTSDAKGRAEAVAQLIQNHTMAKALEAMGIPKTEAVELERKLFSADKEEREQAQKRIAEFGDAAKSKAAFRAKLAGLASKSGSIALLLSVAEGYVFSN